MLASAVVPAYGQSAAPVPGTSEASTPAPAVTWEWRDHPTLRVGGSVRIEGRFRVQVDATDADTVGTDNTADGLDIARRRVGVRGELFRIVEFEVDRELQRARPWRDIWVNVAPFRALQVQVGQFKLPFGLDENVSSTNLNVVNRALLSTHLAPGRDRGIMLHGRLPGRIVRYEAALFDRDGRNARSTDPERVSGGRTLAARVRVDPFVGSRGRLARLTDDLHVGVALTQSTVPTGLPAVRGRMVLESSFFPARYFVSGVRHRIGGEARWRPGPFSVESEWVRLTSARVGQSVEDRNLSPLVATGWYVSGTYAVTGERKSRGLERPARSFPQRGIGAVEVAVRLESLAFRSASGDEAVSTSPRAEVVRGNRDRARTVGVNWYMNRWIKVQANLIHERLDDPSMGPMPDRATFWSRILRFQLTL